MKASIKFNRKVKWISMLHYWNSKFLGHTCSDDLVKEFNDGLNELNLTKLIQISMDSPNSNLKFLNETRN